MFFFTVFSFVCFARGHSSSDACQSYAEVALSPPRKTKVAQVPSPASTSMSSVTMSSESEPARSSPVRPTGWVYVVSYWRCSADSLVKSHYLVRIRPRNQCVSDESKEIDSDLHVSDTSVYGTGIN